MLHTVNSRRAQTTRQDPVPKIKLNQILKVTNIRTLEVWVLCLCIYPLYFNSSHFRWTQWWKQHKCKLPVLKPCSTDYILRGSTMVTVPSLIQYKLPILTSNLLLIDCYRDLHTAAPLSPDSFVLGYTVSLWQWQMGKYLHSLNWLNALIRGPMEPRFPGVGMLLERIQNTEEMKESETSNECTALKI